MSPQPRLALTAKQLTARLAVHFAPPAYAFLPEVRNGTGYQGTTRTADALAMSLWPSRGLELHGFELKSSRSDWKRELDDPAKAEEIASRCDRWWLVVGDANIVKPGELPAAWGLMVPKGDKLAIEKAPEKLDSKPLDRAFVAAILRKVTETWVRLEDLDTEVARRLELAKTQLQASLDMDNQQLKQLLEQHQKGIADFEAASGVKIALWNAGNIGAAVRGVLHGEGDLVRRQLEFLRDQIKRIAERIDAALTVESPK